MADSENWERQTLEKLAFSALQEQRSSRHWSIFFRIITMAFLFLSLFAIMGWFSNESVPSGKHTALVELRGVISAKGEADADRVISGLAKLLKTRERKALSC